MKLLGTALTGTLFLLLTACGSGSDTTDEQPSLGQALGADTSSIAGFWDFSSKDVMNPDEQYVDLAANGSWDVYARFPNDPNSQNCYDRQSATIEPLGDDQYRVSSETGLEVEIGLTVVDNALQYTIVIPHNGTTSTSSFAAVQGIVPADLPICN